MTELALALRLVRAGGPVRALLVGTGSAVGVVVLLLATAVAGTLPAGLSADDRRFAVCLLLFLLLPVVALLASTTRLSAAVRDRRLAALRLLGMTARRTRLVAGYEATVLSSAGAAAGSIGFLAVRPLLQAADESWQGWFGGRPLAPPTSGWLLALVGVPLLALVVSVAPVQRSTRSALAARRQGPARRPGWWRLLPLAAGTGLLAWTAVHSPDSSQPPRLVVPFFAGAALSALALPLVVPVAVRLVADAGVRLLHSPGSLIAARRLQQEPAGTTRLVAALLVALFVVAGGRCVLVAFEQTPQYQRSVLAATTGPQLAQLDLVDVPGPPLDLARMRSTPGVRAVVPARQLQVVCDAQVADGFGRTGGDSCGDVFGGTCAELAAFAAEAAGCRDDQAAWLDHGYESVIQPTGTSVTVRPATDDAAERAAPAADRVLEITDIGLVSVRPDPRDLNWTPQQQLFLPTGTPGLAALLPAPQTWAAVLDGGEAPVRQVEQVAGPGFRLFDGVDRELLRQGDGYRAILWAVAGVVLSVGLAALLIAGVDRAVERRHHLAALSILGVPTRVVRRSQLLQAAAPLVIGLPVAGGTGLLAGTAYLNLEGSRSVTPWPAVTALVLGAVGAGLVVAAATVAGLGGRVRADDLRQT